MAYRKRRRTLSRKRRFYSSKKRRGKGRRYKSYRLSRGGIRL